MCGHYLGYLEDRPDSVTGAVRAIARVTSGAAIVHCAAGKDRTGVVVALALSAVGVPADEVVADYAATDERIEAILRRLMRSRDLRERPEGTRASTGTGPRPETMKAFLEQVEARYGGVTQWLAGHGFGPEDLERLRAKLVVADAHRRGADRPVPHRQGVPDRRLRHDPGRRVTSSAQSRSPAWQASRARSGAPRGWGSPASVTWASSPMAGAFAAALSACGRDPTPALVDRLVAADAELLVSRTSVCEDTVPFLAALRAEGIRIALVSNCADNTRAMLAAKGLLDLADAAILSCEVGVAKPDPGIYLVAIQEVGVLPADALMLDDQPRFCAGAEAVGVRAIQVVRPGIASKPADPRYLAVPSLLDVLPVL